MYENIDPIHKSHIVPKYSNTLKIGTQAVGRHVLLSIKRRFSLIQHPYDQTSFGEDVRVVFLLIVFWQMNQGLSQLLGRKQCV